MGHGYATILFPLLYQVMIWGSHGSQTTRAEIQTLAMWYPASLCSRVKLLSSWADPIIFGLILYKNKGVRFIDLKAF